MVEEVVEELGLECKAEPMKTREMAEQLVKEEVQVQVQVERKLRVARNNYPYQDEQEDW